MFTIARLEVLLITKRKAFVKHTSRIDKCQINEKSCLTITVKKLMKHVKTILERKNLKNT